MRASPAILNYAESLGVPRHIIGRLAEAERPRFRYPAAALVAGAQASRAAWHSIDRVSIEDPEPVDEAFDLVDAMVHAYRVVSDSVVPPRNVLLSDEHRQAILARRQLVGWWHDTYGMRNHPPQYLTRNRLRTRTLTSTLDDLDHLIGTIQRLDLTPAQRLRAEPVLAEATRARDVLREHGENPLPEHDRTVSLRLAGLLRDELAATLDTAHREARLAIGARSGRDKAYFLRIRPQPGGADKSAKAS